MMLGAVRGASRALAARSAARLVLAGGTPRAGAAAAVVARASRPRDFSTTVAAAAKAIPRAQTTAGSSALRAMGGTRTVGGILVLGAVAYVTYEMVQSGRTLESILDDLGNMLSSSLEEHVDPTPEAFLPSVLQAQMIPEEMQAGRLDEPYTTYVVQLEGTLLRKQFDRQAGFKHMIRPHAEDTLRLVAKEGKGKSHVWFWGSESQAQASVMTESLFLGTEKERGVGMTTFQSLAPAFLGKEHRFKDHAGQEDAKERRSKGGGDEAPAPETDVTQRLASEQFLVKRVEPLPRLSGSTILVDHELRNYQVNPDNTILLPEFKELKEDDNELLTLVAFIRLFRSLYKRKEVRTAKEAIAWLKARHPDIAINPFSMGQHIREESSVISRELALMERNSLSAAAKSVGRHTLIGAGRAITPATTRLTTDSMPEGSLVASRVAKVKSRNKAWQQEQAKAARKAAGEE